MRAAELLSDLASHGITLEADGRTLRYYATEGALTPKLRERIKAHKGELLADLTKDTANMITNLIGPCPSCGCAQWWQLPGHPWHCRHCEPLSGDTSRGATTLTLSCHKVQSPCT
jgi:hypothetical protein